MIRKPRDEKLASQIVEEFHLAGQRGDVAAFKRLSWVNMGRICRQK
jgi:hypothetical protein